MKTKQEQKEITKLLNEMSRAYSRGDKLTVENKKLKKQNKKLLKTLKFFVDTCFESSVLACGEIRNYKRIFQKTINEAEGIKS